MRQPLEASLQQEMRSLAERARGASRLLARAPTAQKDEALRAAAAALGKRSRAILAENRADVAAAKKAGQPAAFLDRLALDAKRLDAVPRGPPEGAALPRPGGE